MLSTFKNGPVVVFSAEPVLVCSLLEVVREPCVTVAARGLEAAGIADLTFTGVLLAPVLTVVVVDRPATDLDRVMGGAKTVAVRFVASVEAVFFAGSAVCTLEIGFDTGARTPMLVIGRLIVVTSFIEVEVEPGAGVFDVVLGADVGLVETDGILDETREVEVLVDLVIGRVAGTIV